MLPSLYIRIKRLSVLCIPAHLLILFRMPHMDLEGSDRVWVTKRSTSSLPTWPGPDPQTYHMVDTGEWCVVSDGLKGRPGPIAISGGGHFPAELHRRLIDASLAAALPRDGIPREMRVAGGDTDQRIAWGGGFLDSFLGNLFYMVIVCKRDNLQRSNKASAWVWRREGQRTKASQDSQDHLTSGDSWK